jgi:hypothetical protein
VAYEVLATGIRTERGRVAGVETTAGTLATDAVVVAAGVWTPHLTRTAGLDVPIMPVIMSELETAPVPPLFAATLRAFGFGARQRPGGEVVVSAGLNARDRHDVSLADLHWLRWWAPRALSFRKAIRLSLDVRRFAAQVRHRSTLGTALVPAPSPEPPVDARLVDASLQRLAQVVPDLAGTAVVRRWGGLVDMTPDGLPVVDGSSGPDGLVVVAPVRPRLHPRPYAWRDDRGPRADRTDGPRHRRVRAQAVRRRTGAATHDDDLSDSAGPLPRRTVLELPSRYGSASRHLGLRPVAGATGQPSRRGSSPTRSSRWSTRCRSWTRRPRRRLASPR